MPTRPRRGLAVVLACLAVVLVLAVLEAFAGPTTVARTTFAVLVGLLLVTVAAVVARVAGRRTTGGGRVLTGLAVLAVALTLVAGWSAYRGHTASSRFTDRLAAFPLPDGYKPAPADGAGEHADGAEHVARAWRVPPGADACRDLEKAFRAWAEEPVDATERNACDLDSDGQDGRAEAGVSDDGSTVWVEMWLEKQSLVEL